MENLSDYSKQILISKTAQDALVAFRETNPVAYEKFTKWFHLRPGTNDITIVTTHQTRPMRGIHIGRTLISETIKFLSDCINADGETIEWDKIEKKYNAGKGFEIGSSNGNKEYPYQAEMINNLHSNNNLKELLVVESLYFIASEVIFSRGNGMRKKLDIVAHDGDGKVFFFELKSPKNKRDNPVEQVKGYLKMYGKGGMKNNIFEEMMKNYPQNPIDRVDEYIGYGVIGYSNEPLLKEEMLIRFK